MTDDIKWGEAILTGGKRPEWLEPETRIQVKYSFDDRRWDGHYVTIKGDFTANGVSLRRVPALIRLPADHEYYSRTEQPAPAYPPELVARMVAHFRKVCEEFKDRSPKWDEHLTEARAILSELEPKDPDMELANQIAEEHGFIGGPAAKAVLAGIKRVREGG